MHSTPPALPSIDVGGVYFINYNKRLDCFWIDRTYTHSKAPEQYVCIPFVSAPIRHIAALYDGKPRDIYTACNYEPKICKASNYLFHKNTKYFELMDQPAGDMTLEELTNAG